MLFHAGAPLSNRHGEPFREPKANEKPRLDPKTGAPQRNFDDDQLRPVRYGDVALVALDTTLDGDEKLSKEDTTKWVRMVMRREGVASKIAEAMKDGDGWVTLKDADRDLLIERLGLSALRLGIAMVGPVMGVLESPPEAKPAPTGAADQPTA